MRTQYRANSRVGMLKTSVSSFILSGSKGEPEHVPNTSVHCSSFSEKFQRHKVGVQTTLQGFVSHIAISKEAWFWMKWQKMLAFGWMSRYPCHLLAATSNNGQVKRLLIGWQWHHAPLPCAPGRPAEGGLRWGAGAVRGTTKRLPSYTSSHDTV
jgi:hypothetical protein